MQYNSAMIRSFIYSTVLPALVVPNTIIEPARYNSLQYDWFSNMTGPARVILYRCADSLLVLR